MAFGTINELSTTQGYRRLIKLANHPVLTQILKGIIREESVHTNFYRSVARLELSKSDFSQKIARFVVEKFWQPVGNGTRSKGVTENTINILFGDKEGIDWIDRSVTKKIQLLPGFEGITKINDQIVEITCDVQRPKTSQSLIA